jgi:hypothetical protein
MCDRLRGDFPIAEKKIREMPLQFRPMRDLSLGISERPITEVYLG